MKPLHSKIKAALTVVVLGVAATSFYACLLPVGDGLAPGGGLLSSNGDVPSADTSFFAVQVQPIFSSKCTVCHSPTGSGYAQTGLDLTAGNSYGKLVGVTTNEAATTAPTLRVAPGDTAGSYLVQKIESASPKSGLRMPLGGPYLSAGDINTIKTWIQNGANK